MAGRQSGDLDGLVGPGGAVIVPPEVAAEVLRRLVRDIVTEARSTGAQPSPAARQLLAALYDAAHAPDSPAQPPKPAAVPGHPGEALSVRETAERMGCSPQHVRALLAAGKLPGRKTRGGWIVYTGLADSQASQRNAS